MSQRTKWLLAMLMCAGACTPALGQHRLGGPLVDGTVVRVRGCGSHFFIAYHNNYVLAEWLGGDMVRENEILQSSNENASLEREGRMTFTDATTGRPIDLVIEKALMSPAEFARTEAQVCH
jgi:hypothetical protein